MALYFRVNLNTTRNGVILLPPEQRAVEARGCVKMLLVPRDAGEPVSDAMLPDCLVTDTMVKRFLEIRPPIAAVIPEFQSIIDEIEHAYVLGYPFAALSASCVSTERLLNLARIQLHKHHPKIKDLWNKGPLNEWDGNIEALEQWGYFDAALSVELKWVFRNIRCKYLHSGEITDLASDALRAVQAAYRVLCWAYR